MYLNLKDKNQGGKFRLMKYENKSSAKHSIRSIQIMGKYKVRGKDIGSMLYECRKIY